MALFYVRDGAPFIPEQINPALTKLAKAIVKTCRLSFKAQLKMGLLNNALKSEDPAVMLEAMQKCMTKNRAIYDKDMALSGAAIGEVDDAFFADKDLGFFRNQIRVLLDFAVINVVIEARMFPLMSAACEKTLGKKINELLFFTNQGEIRDAGEEAPEEDTPEEDTPEEDTPAGDAE